MERFILIPGFWLGAWAWRNVANDLSKKGHEIHPLTLTGLADKSHLASKAITLDTHVADVVNLIKFEDLYEVHLVGHSYGGVVSSAVADAIPERISKLTYVDAVPITSGFAHIDYFSPEQLEGAEFVSNTFGDGWRLPFPAWEHMDIENALSGLNDESKSHMEKFTTFQPLNPSRQKISFQNKKGAEIVKTIIMTTLKAEQIKKMVESNLPQFEALNNTHYNLIELNTGHYPMFSTPVELADILLNL